MNNQVVYTPLLYCSWQRGFSVLRFNFRGVGRSQGYLDNGPGELADAASALDWLQIVKPGRARPAGSPASRSAPGSPCSC